MEDVVKMMRREIGDAMANTLGLKVDSTFTVGIDLEAALANPAETLTWCCVRAMC